MNFLDENNIESDELGYIGDGLNDYGTMSLAGSKVCPADAAP